MIHDNESVKGPSNLHATAKRCLALLANFHWSKDPRRWNVTTSMVGLKAVTHANISPKLVNPRDKAGNAEEEDWSRVIVKITQYL